MQGAFKRSDVTRSPVIKVSMNDRALKQLENNLKTIKSKIIKL